MTIFAYYLLTLFHDHFIISCCFAISVVEYGQTMLLFLDALLVGGVVDRFSCGYDALCGVRCPLQVLIHARVHLGHLLKVLGRPHGLVTGLIHPWHNCHILLCLVKLVESLVDLVWRRLLYRFQFFALAIRVAISGRQLVFRFGVYIECLIHTPACRCILQLMLNLLL